MGDTQSGQTTSWFNPLALTDPTATPSDVSAGARTLGLLGSAAGLLGASGASRLPISTGQAIGQGIQGFVQGQQGAQQLATSAQQLQAARLANQLTQAALPAKTALLGGLFGSPGDGGSPASGAGGGLGLTAGATAGQNGPAYLSSPQGLDAQARLALATGQDRAAAALYALPQQMAGGAGYAMGSNGTAFAVPGGSADPTTIAGRSYATAAGEAPVKIATAQAMVPIQGAAAGAEANARVPAQTATAQGTAAARAQYEPFTYTAAGPDGQMREYTGSRLQLPAATGGAVPPRAMGTAPPVMPSVNGQVQAESGGNPTARNPMPGQTSSGAAGFIDSTYVDTFKRTFPQEAVGMSDAQILATKTDGSRARVMTDAYARQNAQALGTSDPAVLALAHHFGPGGAQAIMRQQNPNTPIGLVLPQSVMAANPDLAGKTVGDVLAQARRTAASGGPRAPGSTVPPGIQDRMPQAAVPSPGGAAPGVAPGAGAPPGIPGKPVLTPQQAAETEALGKAYGAQAASVVDAGQKAPKAMEQLDVLQNAFAQFRPGTTGTERLAAGKALADGLQTLGITPPAWLTDSTAAGETIGKVGGQLTADMTRSLGSREALGVFNSIKNIMPNVEMSQGGFQVILNSLRQGVQRDADLADFQDKWLSAHSSVAGMRAAFEASHPVESYASRVVPYPMPASRAAARANVIYNTPRGPALWDGSQFSPVGQ